jgi:NAD+---dinitrogen-reductase ADP-D-ribosyltransferase
MDTPAAELPLPAHAHLPVNRCNLAASLLGSLTFQRHPTALHLDGVQALHGDFFALLDTIHGVADRAHAFKDFMRASFLLDRPDEAGLDPASDGMRRAKADYLRVLRGWLFDADGQEAAVLKSWVESRFGLLPRNHHGPLGDSGSDNYRRYLAARSHGLYNTNALEAQLDLLYTYCQYELAKAPPAAQRHLILYRGLNRINDYEVLAHSRPRHWVLVMNNLNSFTADAERADEFGDIVVCARVPLAKILFMPGLLPGSLQGEQEYLVIGGVYELQQL